MQRGSAGIFMSKVGDLRKRGAKWVVIVISEGPGAANSRRCLPVTCCECEKKCERASVLVAYRIWTHAGDSEEHFWLKPWDVPVCSVRSGLKWLVSICAGVPGVRVYPTRARARASSQISAETCCLRLMKVTAILQSIAIIKALFIKNKLY